MKIKVRTINIDGIRYRWRVGAEQFSAFREGTSNKALRIRFPGAYAGIGWPSGWVKVRELGLSINLHRPRCAAALIRRALELGWSPDAPMMVEDGYAVISKLPTSVLAGIAELQFYEEVVERFADAREPGLRRVAVEALVNRGIALHSLGRYEEEVHTYDELMNRFGNHLEPEARELVATALVNRAVVLSRLNRREEEIQTYDEIVQRFGESPEAALRQRVAAALANRGLALAELNRGGEAIRSYDEVIRRFRDDPEPAIQEIVREAWSKLNPPISS